MNEQRIDDYLDDLDRQREEQIRAELEDFRQRVDTYLAWPDGIIAEHKALMRRMEAETS